MIPTPSSYGMPSQLVASHPFQSAASSFWNADNVRQHLRSLQDTVDLAKALLRELEQINTIRQSNQDNVSSSESSESLLLQKILKEKRISLDAQESLSLEAANSVISTLRAQLAPLDAVVSQTGSWEERSMAVRLAQKLQKAQRNKRWKKKKRKRVAEELQKEREAYDKADQAADEWRTREIAKDIARRKVENMKEIAKQKANEEKKRLESELELVLVVEKLQELRSIRIQKLKKQGHFLPEEDNKFIQRVQEAVEEEERLAAAAADTGAAKDAIAIAEVSRKTVVDANTSNRATDLNLSKGKATTDQDQSNEMARERKSVMDANLEIDSHKHQEQTSSGYDLSSNLPPEFYHYYHGSSNDMGTLIEVRRMWDAYIRPGGSRIPGHWVQPPPPANEVWASYLVRPKQ